MPIKYIIEPMAGSQSVWSVYLPGEGDGRYLGMVSLESSFTPLYGKREWYEAMYSGAAFRFQTKEQAAQFLYERRKDMR